MKRGHFMFFFALLFLSSFYNLSAQRISVTFDDMVLEKALKEIEANSNYYFFYQSNTLDPSAIVSGTFENETIETILNNLLKDSDLQYNIDGKHIVISKSNVSGNSESLQFPRTISGRVIDDQGNPVPGASIRIKGTNTGTITDKNGDFQLTIEDEKSMLIISFVGMKSKELSVEGKTYFPVTLYQDIMGLDDVVVIGYGFVRKSDLTGTVASVDVDEISQAPVAQLSQALSGRVAGVHIQQTSGRPGESPSIRIRGGNSINGNNAPLFVIDGFISAYGAQSINPEDIESIEILKDASATAIYGSRGANGVVLITTKSGKPGEDININYKSVFGTQSIIKKLDMLDAEGHMNYLNDYRRYYDFPLRFPEPVEVSVEEDWQDAMLRNGTLQNHYISIDGSTDRTSYFVSIDYFDQEGIVIHSDYQRISTRLNLDIDLSDKLKTGFKFSYLQTNNNDVSNIFFDALGISPTKPVYNEDGSYNYLLSYDTPGIEIENPIEVLNEYTNLSHRNIIGLQGYLDLELSKNFVFRSEISLSGSNKRDNKFIPSHTLSGRQNQSTAALSDAEKISIETVNTLTYLKEFKNQKVGFVVGTSTISENFNSFKAVAKDITSDVLMYYNLGTGNPLQNSVDSEFTELRQLSFLGRFNYNVLEKYLVTISGRYDGSSNFGENNRFAFFPSAAFAWRLSQEEFIRNLNIFDNLKFRISYGHTGNQSISPYQTHQLLKPKTTVLGNNPVLTFMPVSLANRNLKWETTRQFNTGLDFGFFRNKLYFNVDYYHKITEDLLLAKSIPSTTGFTSIIDNIGSIENKGIELEVNAYLFEKENFSWKGALSYSRNENKILDLGDVDYIFPDDSKVKNAKTDNTNILQVGEPVGTFYTYVYDGIFKDWEEIEAYPSLSGTLPGAMKILDRDENGVISEADKTITGYAQPDFIFGINNEFRLLKNIYLTMFWQGAVGGEILNYNNYLFTIDQSNIPVALSDYWTPDNTDAALPSPGFSGLVTDNYIEDASYIRLKLLSLNYQFPGRFLKNIKISSCSVFLTATDILTFTNYTGINPEVNFFGDSNTIMNADYNSYPTTKSITGGIRIKL
ncbi:MAG: TonB-dependent receptor [Bacteroidales bacterium]|nr:TonB-dependent receptor [Bacteroidales bacterium]